jgi:hypothetical protein
MQALFMNLVPPSSRFFFNSGPKMVLFLSLNVKGDQQTHNKMIPPIMASISRKSSNKVPKIIFRCYIMGDEPIIIEQFFFGFEGVIMGLIMGSQNIMGSDYGSNISVLMPQIEYREVNS